MASQPPPPRATDSLADKIRAASPSAMLLGYRDQWAEEADILQQKRDKLRDAHQKQATRIAALEQALREVERLNDEDSATWRSDIEGVVLGALAEGPDAATLRVEALQAVAAIALEANHRGPFTGVRERVPRSAAMSRANLEAAMRIQKAIKAKQQERHRRENRNDFRGAELAEFHENGLQEALDILTGKADKPAPKSAASQRPVSG